MRPIAFRDLLIQICLSEYQINIIFRIKDDTVIKSGFFIIQALII